MKKGDKIVLVVLLVLVVVTGGVALIYKTSIKGTENIAVIKREGTVLRTIDLNKVVEPQEFIIKTDKGNYNTILVKNKGICIIDADCPHKECVKSGWISQPGEMIVCLPYKLIISIQGQGNKEIDGGTF